MVLDETTYPDALAVLDRYDLDPSTTVIDYLEARACPGDAVGGRNDVQRD